MKTLFVLIFGFLTLAAAASGQSGQSNATGPQSGPQSTGPQSAGPQSNVPQAAGANPASAPAAGAAQPASVDDNARKARHLVEQSIQALGGKAYLNFFDMKQQGRGFGFYRNESKGVGVPYTRLYQFPDKERYEYFRDAAWVIIHNGDKGYETTFHGTHEEDPKDLKEYLRRSQFALDRILRGWASDPKTAFFFDGQTIAETRQVYKITLVNAQNQPVTLFLNTQTLLPVKRTFTWRDTETKEVNEESELYDNYRLVQGISTPYLITRTMNGEMVSQRFLRTVIYNVGVGDAVFQPAAVKLSQKK